MQMFEKALGVLVAIATVIPSVTAAGSAKGLVNPSPPGGAIQYNRESFPDILECYSDHRITLSREDTVAGFGNHLGNKSKCDNGACYVIVVENDKYSIVVRADYKDEKVAAGRFSGAVIRTFAYHGPSQIGIGEDFLRPCKN